MPNIEENVDQLRFQKLLQLNAMLSVFDQNGILESQRCFAETGQPCGLAIYAMSALMAGFSGSRDLAAPELPGSSHFLTRMRPPCRRVPAQVLMNIRMIRPRTNDAILALASTTINVRRDIGLYTEIDELLGSGGPCRKGRSTAKRVGGCVVVPI
ncbi:hypothetical protein BDW75DRAFT_34627 [Aspergillus navahoensis]